MVASGQTTAKRSFALRPGESQDSLRARGASVSFGTIVAVHLKASAFPVDRCRLGLTAAGRHRRAAGPNGCAGTRVVGVELAVVVLGAGPWECDAGNGCWWLPGLGRPWFGGDDLQHPTSLLGPLAGVVAGPHSQPGPQDGASPGCCQGCCQRSGPVTDSSLI